MPATHRPTDPTPDGGLDEGPLRRIVGYQVAQASAVTNAVFFGVAGTDLALRPVEFTVLVLVAQNPGVTPGKLARALAVTPANITPCLERLQGRGLVQRSRSAHDRRTQHVEATDAGRALAGQAVSRLIDAEADALAVLSASEQALLAGLLHKLARGRRPR